MSIISFTEKNKKNLRKSTIPGSGSAEPLHQNEADPKH